MLKQITIQNLAILDDITLEFSDHFNVLTGETGAGKSIIIDALSLVFGARASVEMVRHGKDMARIEALLYLKPKHAQRIQELTDIDVHEECILQRCIYANGRSTAKCNGYLIPLNILNQIAEFLIDIHSQHESQYLLKADQHLPLLDQYICSYQKDYLQEYQQAFDQYSHLLVEKKFLENASKDLKDIDYLKFQYQELQDVLTEQEEEKMIEEYKELQHFEKNAAMMEEVLQYLDGNQQAIDSLYHALKSIQKIENSEKITDYKNRIESAYIDIQDVTDSLKKEFNIENFDTHRLDELSEQITKTNRLKRKYQTNHLFQLKTEIQEKIENAYTYQEKIENLTLELQKQKEKCFQLADKVTKCRKKYANQLEKEIQQQLADLYLEKASFSVHFEKSEHLTKYGNDLIEFYISTNQGEPQKPLVKIASGGEVSRIMLGLKTIFCKVTELDLIVFDEIDTGVSGKVAMAMGKKMHSIAQFAQVLAVTHLPQVACFSDQHLYIYKETKNNHTQTKVEHLTHDRKIMEIARLLSGEKITENSINTAKDLLSTKQ